MPQFLKYQNTGSFPNYEAVSVAIKGATCSLRLVIAGRKRPHGSESTDPHGSDRGLRAARNHHIGIASLNDSKRIANGMRTCSTGGAGRGVWTCCTQTD